MIGPASMAGGNGKSTGKTDSPKNAPNRARGAKGKAATKARQLAFLAEFRLSGIIAHAATRAGITRRTVHVWRKKDPEFEKAFIEADEDATDSVVAEIRRRGLTGIERPLTHQGRLTGDTIIEYSDKMLELAARIRGLLPTGDQRYAQHVDDTVQAQDEEFL